MALNVTLTAINSIIAIVSLPIITNLAIVHYDQSGSVSLQLGKSSRCSRSSSSPLPSAMVVRGLAPGLARRADKGVRIGSAVILAVLVIGIIVDQRENVADYLAEVGLPASVYSLFMFDFAALWGSFHQPSRRAAHTCHDRLPTTS